MEFSKKYPTTTKRGKEKESKMRHKRANNKRAK